MSKSLCSVKIRVRFVKSDNSILEGEYQGQVTNPEISVESNNQFKKDLQNLFNGCNSTETKESNFGYADDLSIFSIIFDNGSKKWQLQPSDSDRKYDDIEEMIKTVDRVLKKVRDGKDPDYDPIREYLKVQEIDLSKLL